MIRLILALLLYLAAENVQAATVDRSTLERLSGDSQVGYLFDDTTFAAANPPEPILPPMVRRVSRAAAMAEAAGLGASFAEASGDEYSSETREEWFDSADRAYCSFRYELAPDSFDAYEQALREYAAAVADDAVIKEEEKEAIITQVNSALEELDACLQAAKS